MDLKINHRDLVELKENDVFKNRPFEAIMVSKDKILIDTSVGNTHSTAIVHPDMVAKVTPREEYERMSSENEAVQIVLEKHLFSEFNH